MQKKIIFFLLTLLTVFSESLALIKPQLIDIQKINETIEVDLFLADPQNFLYKALYHSNAKAYIDKEVADKLNCIQQELALYNLGLKIKDAYRPFSVQKELWEIGTTMNIENLGNYISDPIVEGGRHPRGVAVDVTLITLTSGVEVHMPPMGFVEEAHHGYIGDLTSEQIKNREFLKKIMEKHGFVGISCEWWHYNLPNWYEYEALDKSFDELNL